MLKVLKCLKLKHIILILFIGIYTYSITEPLYLPTALQSIKKNHYIFPKVIAKKGLTSNKLPGNSLSAIKDAISSKIDAIEIDVRISRDGILFLYDSDKLEDYTDHNGEPEKYDWSYLAEVKYKNTEEKLVRLDDILNIVGNKKIIFLDIKSQKIIDNNIAYKVVELIKQYHCKDNVFVQSFNPITLFTIRLYSRDIMLIYNFTDNTKKLKNKSEEQLKNIPWILKQYWIQKQVRRIIRPDILGPRFNFNPNILKSLISDGYPVISWTINDTKTTKFLYKLGVKGFQTNNPQLIETEISGKYNKISDAGDNSTIINEIINVNNIKDIQDAIKKAKKENKKLTIGGCRHSMGGQTLYNNSIFLNLLNFNKVTYNAKKQTMIVQSGATWKKIQEILAQHGRSVKVMQASNIFSIGGSISANVHGWQTNSAPLGSTILNMTVITTDGKIKKISPTINQELFNAVIGGYGMFAIIIDAEIETVPNNLVKFNTKFIKTENIEKILEETINQNPKIELAYGRFSIDKNNFLDKIGVFFYEFVKPNTQTNEISQEEFIPFKRYILRLSEYFNLAKKLRWYVEKTLTKSLEKRELLLNRNNIMTKNTDIHLIWRLDDNKKDILHEYFIPKDNLYSFIKKLKNKVKEHNMNMLNMTLRIVKKDNISLLPYAKEDMYALVCLFVQEKTIEGENKMKQFTQSVIDDAISLKGTFYLPYRLHYTKNQILSAYPEIKNWISLKEKYDPDSILYSQFFSYMKNLVTNN